MSFSCEYDNTAEHLQNVYGHVGNDPVNKADSNGLFTVAVGMGASYSTVVGMEGSGGVYVNTTDRDAGVYGTGGNSWGANISGSIIEGSFIRGNVENFASSFDNVNMVLGPVSLTTHYSGGEVQGITIGFGPGLPIPQVSVSQTNTVAVGVRDFADWINDRFAESMNSHSINVSPCR